MDRSGRGLGGFGRLGGGSDGGAQRPGGLFGGWWRVGYRGDGAEGPLAVWEAVSEKVEAGEACVALTNPEPHERRNLQPAVEPRGGIQEWPHRDEPEGRVRESDQGGGLSIWRARDKNNHYIARYNPVENLRLYELVDGKRTQLATRKWRNRKVRGRRWRWSQDNHITVSLDGKVLLEHDSNTFGEAGGVGLWTKADAATVFRSRLCGRTDRAQRSGNRGRPGAGRPRVYRRGRADFRLPGVVIGVDSGHFVVERADSVKSASTSPLRWMGSPGRCGGGRG